MKIPTMTLQTMKALFDERGIKLTELQASRFHRFYGLLRRHNEDYDLTRITLPEEIVIKHFIDSIYVLGLMDLPSPLLDMGTGAGFPGIPIKIMMPGLPMILAEPRKKRVEFMEMAVRDLGLESTEFYPHLVTGKSFFTVHGVITRALEEINGTLSRVSHFLPELGRVIFMKGPAAGEDMDAISPGNRDLYGLVLDREYTLPSTDYRRRLLVYEKRIASVKRTYRIFVNTGETLGSPVTSTDNKKYKALKKLLTPKGIKEAGKTIASGAKIVRELMKDPSVIKDELIIHDGSTEEDREIMETVSRFHESGKLLILKKSLYTELDIFNTGRPLVTVTVPEIGQWGLDLAEGLNLLVPFQDPVNVGTLVRTAAGFSVKKIILMKEAANPFHPKSIRASGGAVFKVIFERGPSMEELKKLLEDNDFPLIALDRGGADIGVYRFPERFLLLPGVEGPGLPEGLKINTLSIPISGSINSYNASIAASIAIYEWRKKKDQ